MFQFFGGGPAGFLSNVLSLGVYLLNSYAIYRLAYVRGLPNPIFAFIPFFKLFMLGQIGDSLKYQNRYVGGLLESIPLAYALPLLSIATSILVYPFSTITLFLNLAGEVVVYYLVFDYYTPKYCSLFTILSCTPVLVSFLTILSMIPLIGRLFAIVASLLAFLTVLSPVIGPLLVIYAVKDYKTHY